MKRRIAISILLTVWSLLIAGGTVAYLTVRSVLLFDLDRSLADRAAALAASASPAANAPPQLAAEGQAGERYLITNDLGQTVARPHGPVAASAKPRLLAAAFTQVADGPRQRTVRLRITEPAVGGAAPHTLTITYSASAAGFDALLGQLTMALWGVGAAAGLLAAGVAWQVSKLAMRPLKTTAAQIGSIDEQCLNRRIDLEKLPPELLPVGQRLNEMLRRLEDAFARRRRFLADASHELRTPVASLAMALEIALRYPPEPWEFRQTLQTCFDEARTMRRLVERLMQQARGEQTAGETETIVAGPLRRMDVTALLDGCLQTATPLAAKKQVRLCRDFDAPIEFVTREAVLRSVVLNLLTNAIEYNLPGGRVDLICRRMQHDDSGCGTGLRLLVRDTGIGISREDLSRIFEPFFRLSSARGGAEHLGLGLALVQTNVRALGGVCTVDSSMAGPSRGTIFTVELPELESDFANDLPRDGETDDINDNITGSTTVEESTDRLAGLPN